jgi:hypothetical protein
VIGDEGEHQRGGKIKKVSGPIDKMMLGRRNCAFQRPGITKTMMSSPRLDLTLMKRLDLF